VLPNDDDANASIFDFTLGAQGVQGAQGPQGIQGPPGSPGANGATGPAGPAGPQGVPGPMGPPGVTGPVGPQGPKGDTGATGPQGPIGLMGAAGPQGAPGSQGVSGPPGPVGPAGPVISHLSDLTGTPCSIGSINGTANVSIAVNGAAAITCNSTFTPPTNALDAGTVACGQILSYTENAQLNVPVDVWFAASFASPPCGSGSTFRPLVFLGTQNCACGSDPALKVDVITDAAGYPIVFVGALGQSILNNPLQPSPITAPGRYFIHVYGTPAGNSTFYVYIAFY
jgi:hypothetical protein